MKSKSEKIGMELFWIDPNFSVFDLLLWTAQMTATFLLWKVL